MTKSARAVLRDKCADVIAQHIDLLDSHITALKHLEKDIAVYVSEDKISQECAQQTLEYLRPVANRAVKMRHAANQARTTIPGGKRVREDSDEIPVFDGLPGSGQLLKRRKLTPLSPQVLEELACGQHSRFDENMPDAINVDETSDTMSEAEDFNELVEARLKLQRERRAQRIDNPERMSPAKDTSDTPISKRKRLSGGKEEAGAVGLRPDKDAAVPERAPKRKKGPKPRESMQERGEALRQRSREFFMHAAEVENAAASERGKPRPGRPGTRGSRLARLRRDLETLNHAGA